MRKYVNKAGKECYEGVVKDTPMVDLEFHLVIDNPLDVQYALHTNLGTLTVLDRMTVFGYQDIETGYRSPDGEFWLASGGYDVRHSGAHSIAEAIEWTKKHAGIYNRLKRLDREYCV